MKVKEESEKADLKLNIQKTKIMVSNPITSWQIDGETVETVSDFILGGSKITADDDCNHEIKRCLLLQRKVMTNLDSISKSRDITLPTKVRLVKAMVFPVVMYGCESWNIEKAERWRIDAFELWCWRRLLRVPWTTRRSNQLTYWKRPWCWEGLGAGGEGDDWGWDGWMASLTQWTWVWIDSGSWRRTGRPGVLQFMGSQRVGHDWATDLTWLYTYRNLMYVKGRLTGQDSRLSNPQNHPHPQTISMLMSFMLLISQYVSPTTTKHHKMRKNHS